MNNARSLSIVRYDSVIPHPDQLGAKALSLAELAAADLNVPRWICLSTRVHESYRERGALSAAERADLLAEFDRTFGAGGQVVVRASPVGDPCSELPAFIGVNRDLLCERVEACFAAASSPRVDLFRKAQGHEGPLAIAVIVQRLVDASASGVLRDGAVVAIEATHGLGHRSGQIDADTYVADPQTGMVRGRHVGKKRFWHAPDADRGWGQKRLHLEGADGLAPVLNDADICKLVSLARDLRDEWGPQEIRWVFDEEGRVQLLAAQPAVPGERARIFDKRPVAFDYPGTTRPLAYSIARGAYEGAARSAARSLGVPDRALDASDVSREGLLALIDGRIYCDMRSWYGILEQVPDRGDLLPCAHERLGLHAADLTAPPLTSFMTRLRSTCRRAFAQRRLARAAEEIEGCLAGLEDRWAGMDLGQATPDEVLGFMDEACGALIGPFGAALMAGMLVDESRGAIAALAAEHGLGDGDELATVIAGRGWTGRRAALESLEEVLAEARGHAALSRRLREERRSREVWEALHADPELLDVGRCIHRHLQVHGDQLLRELCLDTDIDATEPRRMVIGVLKTYGTRCQTPAVLQELCEAAVAKRWSAARGALLLKPKGLLRLLFASRRHGRLAGASMVLRGARARAQALASSCGVALGETLAARGILDAAEDVQWLSLGELRSAVGGHALQQDLRVLIGLRKKEYDIFSLDRPRSRIVTYGPVYSNPLSAA